MRKCSICGKPISDFVTNCPYCGSNLNSVNEIENKEEKEHYFVRKRVFISFILSFLSFVDLFLFVHVHVFSGFIDLLLKFFAIGSVVFAIYLIVRYKIITISKNKGFLAITIIIGLVFSVFLLLSYGTVGRILTYGIDFIEHILSDTEYIFDYIVNDMIYILDGIIMSTLIIEARFLFLNRKNK